MRWFGSRPFSPLCRSLERAPIPLGRNCDWCEEEITELEMGYLVPILISFEAMTETGTLREAPYHWECWVRQVIGSPQHILGECICPNAGHTMHRPPELTKRQEAKLAVELNNMKVHGQETN
jgi:hypothetical protein